MKIIQGSLITGAFMTFVHQIVCIFEFLTWEALDVLAAYISIWCEYVYLNSMTQSILSLTLEYILLNKSMNMTYFEVSLIDVYSYALSIHRRTLQNIESR